ncbi:unnamed protein product, partial [marine sediment metagenome]
MFITVIKITSDIIQNTNIIGSQNVGLKGLENKLIKVS